VLGPLFPKVIKVAGIKLDAVCVPGAVVLFLPPVSCLKTCYKYAVCCVYKSSGVVGHMPRRISTLCNMFLRRSGAILCGHGNPKFSSNESKIL